MNMREAVIKTRELHQMVVDGKHDKYTIAKRAINEAACYLCIAAKDARADKDMEYCEYCPHSVFDGNSGFGACFGTYYDSPEAIKRLNRWLADPRLEEL